jgi:hypothetical protein
MLLLHMQIRRYFSDLRQFSDTSVSSTNKSDYHDITEILLKVAINTIKQTNNCTDDNKMNPSCKSNYHTITATTTSSVLLKMLHEGKRRYTNVYQIYFI